MESGRGMMKQMRMKSKTPIASHLKLVVFANPLLDWLLSLICEIACSIDLPVVEYKKEIFKRLSK
tara:strand:+ start:4426 stop:4620 length:195 start_codon:yes stop_codon:yes gene_type:complete